ncbi:MAG: hypothetical protein JW737_00735, partial [Acidobacteria bacterium]|nr:hypothetical protein [Acidobacteriota bacterium]
MGRFTEGYGVSRREQVKPMPKTNLRQISYQILKKVDKGNFHQELLNNLTELDSRDINFVRVLVKGVLKNRILISKFISKYSSRKIDKIESDVLIFLEIGFYQLIWMDSVPDYAALNETLEAMKKTGLHKAAGLVNAVLRAFIRDNKDITWTESLSTDVRYSVPAWLYSRIEKQYSPKFAEKIAESMNNEPDMTVFINTNRMQREEVEKGLQADGIEFERSVLFDDMMIVKGGGITNSVPFKQGALYIQDQGSRLVAFIASKVAEGTILDAAAAPGGKTVNLIADGYEVFAADISSLKLIRLQENLERLHLKAIGL